VTRGLPAGSSFGIAATPRDDRGGIHYAIKLPADWRQGLFALTEKSTLHFTYRLGKPTDALNVFMHTIAAAPNPNRYEMYLLGAPRFRRQAGEWMTTSIPFSRFVRKVRTTPDDVLEFEGGPPDPGERLTTLLFSSPEEIDFVIDRIWVTPDRTGREETGPVSNPSIQ
jgi:hypothetical protein